MDTRIQSVENTVQMMADRMDSFAAQIVDLLGKVDLNDTSMKKEISDKFGILENSNLDIQQNILARTQELQSLSTALNATNQENIDLQDKYTRLRDERVTPMEAVVLKEKEETGIFKTGIAARADELMTDIRGLKMQVEFLKTTKGAESSGDKDQSWKGGKPIMEYKVMQDLPGLSNDKSGFRDWKTRMRDGIASSRRTEMYNEFLHWIEDPTTKPLTGNEGMQMIMMQANTESGIPVEEETWNKLSTMLASLITQKATNGSEGFLIVKRAKTGIAAWYRLNRWMMATTGSGLSSRMGALMKPAQAKKDSEVISELENGWMNTKNVYP